MILHLLGCFALDFAVFSPIQVEEYTLDFGSVPDLLVEEVSFPSTDGVRLHGVWARQKNGAPPMIFFHGNYGNLDDYSDRIEHYWSWHSYDVFTVDYRCFGRSEGSCDSAVVEEDGLATVLYVSEQTGVPPEEIPWVSLSLGSSVAVHTNDEIRARAVVLESMFASDDDVLDDSVGLDLPAGWFFEEEYENVEAIARMQDPVLLIHGRDDSFIPPDHVEELYAAAPDPKELWRPEGVEHADILEVMPEEYQARVLEWFGAAAE